MKKILIATSVVAFATLITNCRKDYDCECTYKVSGKKDIIETWQSNGMGNIGRKQFQNRCEKTVANDTMTCQLLVK